MRSCHGQGLNAEARSENRSTPHARRPAATLTTGAGGAGVTGAVPAVVMAAVATIGLPVVAVVPVVVI